jgi:RNA recognition motif-containing protein
MADRRENHPGKVFLGNLDDRVRKEDIESFIAPLKAADIWIARKPPGFGFIHFDDPRDAEDGMPSVLNVYITT